MDKNIVKPVTHYDSGEPMSPSVSKALTAFRQGLVDARDKNKT